MSPRAEPIGLTRGRTGPQLLVPDELRVVETNAWFASLSKELRDAILSLAFVRCARHGECLFHQGAPAEDWLGVVRGSVRVCHSVSKRRQVVATFAAPGSWIGDTELADGGPMMHVAYAQGDTKLLSISRADFQILCHRYDELHSALLRLQCARLRSIGEQVADLHTLSLEQRMAKQLLRLEHAFGVDAVRGPFIALQVSQSELGELVCASRQRTNSVLKQFEREGILRVSKWSVQIVAHEILRTRAVPALSELR
jgi:CRP/FNR family transcriptional regulator, cyclic AMP receptor protein